jgi:hypothetical protein
MSFALVISMAIYVIVDLEYPVSASFESRPPIRRCSMFETACDREEQGDSMSRYQLAQLNVATLKAPLDSPQLQDFVGNLDRINALAEQSPGFVWRLKGDGNDATSLRPLGDNVLVNMSVWRDVDALRDYVYKTAHVEIMRRKREWFDRPTGSPFALWWVPEGHEPTVAEAVARLQHLRKHGPSAEAFTFGEAFDAPDAKDAGAPFSFEDSCPA